MASSSKLNMDRRKWHFSKNHFFHEETWERCSHQASFSLRKTSQSSPSISGLSLGIHTSNSNLFGWAVRGSLVPHSFSRSCLKLGFAHYTRSVFLTPCNTHMWHSWNSKLIINVCTAPCGKGHGPNCFLVSQWLTSGSLFLLIAERGEK